jgi:hypothetical protein
MSSEKFNIRQVCRPEDGDFLVAALDSTLPQLASIGSGGQWGSTPFSERKSTVDRAHNWISSSEAFRLGEPGSEPLRLFIAEVNAEDGNAALAGLSSRTDEHGRVLTSVGAVGVREHWWPNYVKEKEILKPIIEQAEAYKSAFYLEVLVSDFRAGSARRGVGATMIQKAKEYAVSRGAKALFLDCWAGNSGNLVKYDDLDFDPPTGRC